MVTCGNASLGAYTVGLPYSKITFQGCSFVTSVTKFLSLMSNITYPLMNEFYFIPNNVSIRIDYYIIGILNHDFIIDILFYYFVVQFLSNKIFEIKLKKYKKPRICKCFEENAVRIDKDTNKN